MVNPGQFVYIHTRCLLDEQTSQHSLEEMQEVFGGKTIAEKKLEDVEHAEHIGDETKGQSMPETVQPVSSPTNLTAEE